MIRGWYTAAAGMMSQMMSTDSLANNMANASTVGFKSSEVNFKAFPEMLMNRINGTDKKQIGSMSNGASVASNYTKFNQGDLNHTGNTLDMAIEGEGFFKVQAPNGQILYTRDGNFTVNKDGYLSTQTGDLVLSEVSDNRFEPIEMPMDKILTVNPDGQILADNTTVAKLAITRFEKPSALEKMGSNQYKETPAAKVVPPPKDPDEKLSYKIQQGALEGSNVNVIKELCNTMTGYRMYEALQKNIQIHNETLGKAVNDVGRSA